MRKPVVLGMVVDWGYRPDDLPVRLFGAWTTLPAGPATLAARTRAVDPAGCGLRQPDGTYRPRAGTPIEVADGSARDAAIAATQASRMRWRRWCAPAPDQWFTFKPMWPATAAEAGRAGGTRGDWPCVAG